MLFFKHYVAIVTQNKHMHENIHCWSLKGTLNRLEFEHMVPRSWCCLGKLENLLEVDPYNKRFFHQSKSLLSGILDYRVM